ncbi:MAG: hypothetical protein IPG50_16995 [Myxococcales bacterium]|nr:hypothetical protein [Myxococcales bacterium]
MKARSLGQPSRRTRRRRRRRERDEGGDGSDGDDEGDDDDSDDSDDEDDDDDTSDEGDGEEDTTIGSGGTSAGRTVDDDGGSGGNDYEARCFHPNYLTMDARMMLAMADLAWRRGQGPRPPSGGPTDIWQPFKRKTSSAAPEVARSRGRMLEKSAFMDAALLGALGKQGSHGPSDGSDQIPLTRTVGDEAEAEAAANRDDVRRMLWKKHVEPRILSASQRTKRTG